MHPVHGPPPEEFSKPKEHIVKRIQRATLFVFLRHHRHELLVMRSLKRRSRIGGGSWSSIVLTPIRHREALELWWHSVRGSSKGRWTVGGPERTIELANQSQAFGPRTLRAALESSSLWGAGRVEETYNLVGHALRKVIHVVASQQGEGVG
jgi:hypothetical protein